MKLIFFLMIFAFLFAACCNGKEESSFAEGPDYRALRREMVKTQIEAAGVKDKRVLEAMKKVPRHEFVPDAQKQFAYEDRPLPIGYDQTISQPYIVALMTEAVRVGPKDRVLEIGTGSGYQAAVLGELAKEVYTIEIIEPLGKRAGQVLKRLGYRNVHVRIGDGFAGWPEKAPFNAIVVTAAPPDIPPPLLEQLAEGGRLVIPVGETYPQRLILAEKIRGKIRKKTISSVLFVPMTGEGVKGMK